LISETHNLSNDLTALIANGYRLPRGQSDWIQTFSGIQFWPLDPRPEELLIVDIAHALANMCRFTGHVTEFYSVAQHSVLVANLLESRMADGTRTQEEVRRIALWGLLHDASEAYMVDLARPLKRAPLFGDLYRRFEKNLMAVICEAYGLPVEEPPCVKEADNVLLMTERRDLMSAPPRPWREIAAPMDETIEPWEPEVAERMFLTEFARLGGRERVSCDQEASHG
jgi:5'-deoxynucleotidase YfbR-like HD superfamily hydrolase